MLTKTRVSIRSVTGLVQSVKLLTTAQPKDQRTPAHQEKINSWQIHSYGGVEELQLSRSRAPIISNPSDVVVEVAGSSVNPIDLAMMGSYGSVFLNAFRQAEACSLESILEFPLTLGRDFSGTVIAKGHGVKEVKVGDEVWGVVPPHQQGAHAEQVIVNVSNVHRKPKCLSHIEAGSLPYAAMTAWSALKVTGDLALLPASKKNVLVLGASGGVGTCAVQLLTAWGARVVATCQADAAPRLEEMLVSAALDYTKEDLMELVREEGKYDIILDCAGLGPDNAAPYLKHLKDYNLSKFVTLKSPMLRNVDQHGLVGGMAKNLGDLVISNLSSGVLDRSSTVRWAFFLPLHVALEEITDLVERGKMNSTIDTVFPFDDLPAAFKKVSAGHLRGKVALDMASARSQS